jgi:hypothetical protein
VVTPALTAVSSNYAGCHHDAEAPIDKDNHGLLFLNSRIRYADIFDGSSQTILLGEALNRSDELGWVSGTRATLRNTSVIESTNRRSKWMCRSPSAVPSTATVLSNPNCRAINTSVYPSITTATFTTTDISIRGKRSR